MVRFLSPAGWYACDFVATGVDPRIEASSALDESREIVVASVDAELKTLAELASIEFNVDAKLCFDVLRRNMLNGRRGADNPGDKVPDLGEEVLVVQRRPKKREAAVVTSAVLAALALAIFSSLYRCSSCANFSLDTIVDKLTKSSTNSSAL
ncbi:hypothetical protein RRF57_000031 [Xylaria bambusicola]|uniref:Uncharacterized protein n=1 Tax=Xylaria bambusicola TaxID=326684 RepID=A0AAN7U2Y9_9PEZI